MGAHRAGIGATGHGAQHVPRRPLRGRTRRGEGPHRPDRTRPVERRLRTRGLRHPGAAWRPLPRRRHRPRSRRRRHLSRARGQPPQPERHLVRPGEPRRDDPRAPGRVRHSSRAGGRSLRIVASRRPAPRRTGGGGRPLHRRAHPGRVQLGVLRARVPRAADGRGARRRPRSRRRRARGLHAHDPRASSASTSSTGASTTRTSTP